MKKILLASAVLTLGSQFSAIAAPNDIYLDQIGSNHIANLSQNKPNTQNNAMKVIQRGANSQAYATQAGERNKLVHENNGSNNYVDSYVTGDANNISIIQGKVMPATSSASNSIGTANVQGSGNIITVDQAGLAHTSFNTTIGDGNQIYNKQNGTSTYYDNRTTGSGNIINLDQASYNTGGTITSGNSNNIYTEQTNTSNNAADTNHAYVDTVGNSNLLRASQVVSASKVGLIVRGNENIITGVQDKGNTNGYGNTAYIDAGGNSSYLIIQQIGSMNRGAAYVRGNNDYINVQQHDNANIATIKMIGNDNSITTGQQGGGFNDLWADMQGNLNKAHIQQHADGSVGHVAGLYQNGGDQAYVNQSGIGHETYIHQTATLADATILQSGSYNRSYIQQ